MRFYNLTTVTTNGSNGLLSTPSGNLPGTGTAGVARSWTSFPRGTYDGQSQDIVFDLQIVPQNTPSGATVISIHGVNLEDLFGAQNFRGSSLSLVAGMQGGLPLSTAQPPPGLLINATVLGAFGNWQGTEQTLDLLINPSTYSQDNPGNIVFNWEPGQSFSDAITQTLTTAYPNSKVSVYINPALTTDQQILHMSRTATAHAHFIHGLTYAKSTIGPKYPGVKLYFNGSQIIVTDYSKSTGKTVELKFTDLVGQPTWLEPPTLTINTILRADIQVGTYIKLPEGDIPGPGSVLTMPTIAGTQFANKLNFSGTFIVTGLRSAGQFRGTDADDWITVIQAVPLETFSAV